MSRETLRPLSLVATLLLANCSDNGGGNPSPAGSQAIIVNSLADSADPPPGIVTLRAALAMAADGQPIVFDQSLDGGTIELSMVGEQHTVLKGEVMGMRDEPSGPVSYLVGYFDRDYGSSALYARKNDAIDLAVKIVQLLKDPEKRERMGTFGRNRVLNELEWKYEEPKLLAAYEALWQ